MYGYDDWGYDSFDEKPRKPTRSKNESHTGSRLYFLAETGKIKAVMNLVEKIKDPEDKAKFVINHARRWTEFDEKAGGAIKEFEWFDLTPVSIAARNGHTDVLKYLLKKHADPTLGACYGDNSYSTTQEEAKRYLENATKQVEILRTQTPFPPRWYIREPRRETAEDNAKEVYLSYKRAKYNVSLVEEALTFWETARYAHPSAGSIRPFTNKPKNGLEGALDAIKIPGIGNDPENDNEIALIASTFKRYEEYLAVQREKEKKREKYLAAKHEKENKRKKKQKQQLKESKKRCNPSGSSKDPDDNTLRPQKKARVGSFEPKRLPKQEYESRILNLLKNGKPGDICTLTPQHEANGHRICDCKVLTSRKSHTPEVVMPQTPPLCRWV